tara:strand:- start:27604 stop:27780 length:177 start_codon:yes stop_codon:yes gene_type:complete
MTERTPKGEIARLRKWFKQCLRDAENKKTVAIYQHQLDDANEKIAHYTKLIKTLEGSK